MKRVLSTLSVCALALAGLAGCASTPSDEAAGPAATSASPTSGGTSGPTSGGTSAGGTADGAGTYTMAQVQQHNSAESCWTAINDQVYDVTEWIGSHPGGAARIKGLCGTEGTQAFMGQHEGASRPQERLSSFQIGTLSN